VTSCSKMSGVILVKILLQIIASLSVLCTTGFSALVFAAPLGVDIAQAAKLQIGVTVTYNPAYEVLAFPGGDVRPATGVCTDVIVRALRVSKKLDLQVEIYKDITRNRSAYPKKWGFASSKIDSNIDHRRVPNQMTYFERRGFSLPIVKDLSKYLVGDIVAWNLGGGQLHIGVLSDTVGASGRRLAIHNIGRGTLEEDILLSYPIIGHFRLPAIVKPLNSSVR
jgi:uncharacterized protein